MDAALLIMLLPMPPLHAADFHDCHAPCLFAAADVCRRLIIANMLYLYFLFIRR